MSNRNALVDTLRKLADEYEQNDKKTEGNKGTDGPTKVASKPPTGVTRANLNENRNSLALFAGVLLTEDENREGFVKAASEVLRDIYTAVKEAHDVAGLPPVSPMSWQDVRSEYATMLEITLEKVYDKMNEVDPSFEPAISFE